MTIKEFKTVLSRLIGNANVLSNNVLFIDYCGGNHSKAQFMSQLFYWQSKATRKDGYFFKTYEQWHDEIRVPKHSLLRYSKEFKKLGLLETKTKKANGFPTVHYKLDVDKLVASLVTFCNNGSSQFATNDSDNLQLTLDSDNLQLSSNIDYQRIQTESTNRESAHEETKEQSNLKADKTPSKKVAAKKVSQMTADDWAAKAKEANEQQQRHLEGLRDEDLAVLTTVVPGSWIEAVEIGVNHFDTETGKAELKAMCKAAKVDPGKVDIRVILTLFFGKKKDQPHIWQNPLHYTASLSGWIKTEYNSPRTKRKSSNNQKPNALKVISNDKYAEYQKQWEREQAEASRGKTA